MDWNGKIRLYRLERRRNSGGWIFVYNIKFIHLEKALFCLCLS